MPQTALKVASSPSLLTVALWVGANLLFDQAYDHWTRFNTIIGVGARLRRLLRRRRERLAQDARRQAGAALRSGRCSTSITGWDTRPSRHQRPAVGTDRRCRPRLGDVPAQRAAPAARPVAPGRAWGSPVSGSSPPFALDDSVWPALDWGKLLVCAAVGAVLFGLIGLWRYGRSGGPAVGASPGSPSAGSSAPGAAPTSAPATSVRSSSPPSCPRRSSASASGSPPSPTPTKRRRIDQRSRAWIFVTPALVFIAFGLLVPADPHDLSLVPQPQRQECPSGGTTTRAIFTEQELGELRQLAEHLHQPSLLHRPRLGRARRPRRRVRRPAHEPAVRARSRLGRSDHGGHLRPVVRGPRRRSGARSSTTCGGSSSSTPLATVLGLAVAVLADRAKAENTAKSLIFLPMAISFIGAGIIWRFMYQARDPSQNQTGVLNAIWVWIGESTTFDDGKADLARRPVRARPRLPVLHQAGHRREGAARWPASPPVSWCSTPT